MAQQVTAVIDVGKTNKKFFLFDEALNEVFHEYTQFDEVADDDGFPSEDVFSLTEWMKYCIEKVQRDQKYELKNLNFTTYGASLVHLNKKGEVAVPFYNYLKPLDDTLLNDFFQKYGEACSFALSTSSPVLGMLNSGFQFVYLKYQKPKLFGKIHASMHFPQYLSYIFTNRICSDYTSIGCHTALWNYERQAYHRWVAGEHVLPLLPDIENSYSTYPTLINGKPVKVGIGVHDSSASLVPYLQASEDPFVLISTGTWSICMNYFNKKPLTTEALNNDCLNFLSVNGSNVKASRLFLGKHMSNKVAQLNQYFDYDPYRYKVLPYDAEWSPAKRKAKRKFLFDHGLLKPERFGFVNNEQEDLSVFDGFEEAYHYLMDELTDIQIASLKLAIGRSRIKTIYLDGGFSGNEVFMQMMANKLPKYQLYASSFAKGTALGAAILVNNRPLNPDFLVHNYKLRHYAPLDEVVMKR